MSGRRTTLQSCFPTPLGPDALMHPPSWSRQQPETAIVTALRMLCLAVEDNEPASGDQLLSEHGHGLTHQML